jgi:hypothetical protein
MCTELVDVDWKSQEPDDPKEGYPRYGWLPSRDKERFIRSHALCLSLFERYLEVSRQPLSLRGTAIERVGRELDDPSLGTAVLLMGPFVRVEASDRRHHARLRCAAAMLAAERYRLKFNRWPEKIHDLRDFAAKETLIDPCDGKPLKLRREPDGLVIYSVGVNGLDDGGTAESLKGPDPLDIGFRLWDESHRRHPPVLRPPSDDGLPLGELPPQR